MDLTVVVDGGGSHCHLGAFDSNGALLATADIAKATQLSLGVEQAWANIEAGIKRLAATLELSNSWLPGSLCMGLAGSLQLQRRAQFLAMIPEAIDAKLFTDGMAQLYGVTLGAPGVCLSVGTGSVLHWLDHNGNSGMAGGWGFPAGDEGAAAWLGLKLMSSYCHYRDHYPKAGHSAAFDYLEEFIHEKEGAEHVEILRSGMDGKPDVSQIQQWTTCKNPTELASLAPLVTRAANHNDALACSLLNEGTVHVKQLLACAPGDCDVYLAGGLAGVYIDRLKPLLGKRLQSAKGTVLDGLYLLSAS